MGAAKSSPWATAGGKGSPKCHSKKQLHSQASCDGSSGDCYIRNDGIRRFVGRLTLNVTDFATAETTTALDTALSLPRGAGVIQWMHVAAVPALDGPSSTTILG